MFGPAVIRRGAPRIASQLSILSCATAAGRGRWIERRAFSGSARRQAVKPFLLADIGEGIRECEVIQWFVEPNARVQQFDKLCEVQSDKASVEITSRFDGVIKKLHYEAGDMALVGKPLVDIDIEGEEAANGAETAATTAEGIAEAEAGAEVQVEETHAGSGSSSGQREKTASSSNQDGKEEKHKSLATPAVRHLCKELDIDIADVQGTGKDGRVMKEDLHRHAQEAKSESDPASTASTLPSISTQQDETRPLSKLQTHMFKSMTKSLQIPHFLYSDEADFTSLSRLRDLLNADFARSKDTPVKKLSYLPFIVKAVSLALHDYPIMNASLSTSSSTPSLTYRSNHNISLAIDSPSGLIVPVIQSVQTLTVPVIAAEIARLSSLAAKSSLSPQDLKGGTFTVSNIGTIGGTYVSPVIVEGQLGILGIGQVRELPRFKQNSDEIERRKIGILSFCGDHRVVDGATMARFAETVRGYVEHPERMLRLLS